MAPATTPAATARMRKYVTIVSSESRPASQVRRTAATYAVTATASTPVTIDVGLTQLPHGSPACPPAGTRPEAIPPAIAPKQYGTRTEETAKVAPKARWSRIRDTALRKAKLAPRSTMPSAASVRGTNIVHVIDAYASGKHVQRTTKAKINHTWLASHTGPIEWSTTSRGRVPRFAPPAVRSQKPEPKSAPPKMAYIKTATNKTIAAAVLIRPS